MGLFKSSPSEQPPQSDGPIPVAPIDVSKRYDLYCSYGVEHRLYENIRIVGIRTFSSETRFGSALIGGYIEIEGSEGTRVMIPHLHIIMLCEHGAQPKYKVLNSRWRPTEGEKPEG